MKLKKTAAAPAAALKPTPALVPETTPERGQKSLAPTSAPRSALVVGVPTSKPALAAGAKSPSLEPSRAQPTVDRSTVPVTPSAPLLKPEAAPSAHKETASNPREEKASSPVRDFRKVAFELHEPMAKQVALSGEFNAWSPNSTLMQKQLDGRWLATVALAPGRYQYKFVVDGQWRTDQKAKETVLNPHGTYNSVIEVRI